MPKAWNIWKNRPDLWIVAGLLVPLALHLFRFGHIHQLQGGIYLPHPPSLKWIDWYQGKAQKQTEKWLQHYAGGRGPVLRLNNEFMYLAYGHARAGGVRRALEGELYELDYVEDALGRFLPRSTPKAYDSLLVFCQWQQKLERGGTRFLFVAAPSKAIHRPHRFPQLHGKQPFGNYHWFRNVPQGLKPPVLDVQAWFDDLAAQSPYPLMPKHGIHWSYYGEQLFLDSLVSRLRSMGLKGLPTLEILPGEERRWAQFRDDDLEQGINLLFNRKDELLYYPKLSVAPAPSGPKAKVLVISDSFYWGIFNSGLPSKLFAEHEFWYYYGSRFPKPKGSSSDVLAMTSADRRAFLASRDAIVWISTSPTYWKMGLRLLADLHRMDLD